MLNRHNFQIAELAPTDDDSRFILGGIQVSPSRTAVTDGRCAVIVTEEETEQENLFGESEGVLPADHFTPFILDRETALKVAKAIPKRKEDQQAVFPVVDATTEATDRAMFSINDICRQEILRARKLEGQFPDVDRVFPAPDTAKAMLVMNPELLGGVLNAVRKFGKNRAASITLRFFGYDKPLTVTCNADGQTFTAAIMPMRGDELEGSDEECAN